MNITVTAVSIVWSRYARDPLSTAPLAHAESHDPRNVPQEVWMNDTPAVAFTLVLLVFSQALGAAEPDVRMLAAGCASCHQPSQRVPPPLAGRSREALFTTLRGFRDGSLPGTVMPPIARGYTLEELDALARHFASTPLRR